MKKNSEMLLRREKVKMNILTAVKNSKLLQKYFATVRSRLGYKRLQFSFVYIC